MEDADFPSGSFGEVDDSITIIGAAIINPNNDGATGYG